MDDLKHSEVRCTRLQTNQEKEDGSLGRVKVCRLKSGVTIPPRSDL